MRISGAAALLVGSAVLVLAFGFLMRMSTGAELMRLAHEYEGRPFDARGWATRMAVESSLLAGAAVAMAIAGVALIRGRCWGFLVVTVVFGTLAVCPWVLEAVGVPQVPNLVESTIFTGLAIATADAFSRTRRRGRNTEAAGS